MHFSTFFLFFPLFFCALFEIPGSKDQNVVLACKIRHLNLGPQHHLIITARILRKSHQPAHALRLLKYFCSVLLPE